MNTIDKPEPFDFEAFIAGTQLPRCTVSAYRIDHRDEIARLVAEHDALPPAGGDDREGSKASPRRKIAEQVKALREEMAGSVQEFTIRTLTPDEFKTFMEDDKQGTFEQLALQSISPVLSADQWRKVANVVGSAQWSEMVNKANALILGKVAVPDFSQSVSATLSTAEPSKS